MPRRFGPARLFAFIALAGAAACTSGQVGSYPVTHVDPIQSGVLQFAVGWATGYANANTGPTFGYGLNVVETFRQANGRSAVLNDTPAIVVPSALASAIPLTPPSGAPTQAPTLAPGGAAYGSGFGVPPSLATSFGGQVAPAIGFGGPPAFQPAVVDGTSLTQTFVEGYDTLFPLPPANSPALALAAALKAFPGQYTLQVAIPTGQFSTETASQSATLRGKPLPAFASPQFVSDGNGGGSVTLNVPAGVTESLVTVYATSCQTGAVQPSPSPSPTGVTGPTPSPVQIGISNSVFTLYSGARGPAQVFLSLPDFAGPEGPNGRFHSVCTGADAAALGQGSAVQKVIVYAAGFDYPAFESVYPQSFSQTPKIVGANGQADVTVSALANFTSP
jgi:hypothetical protein